MASIPILMEIGIILTIAYLLGDIFQKKEIPMILGFLLGGILVRIIFTFVFNDIEINFLKILNEVTNLTLGFIGIEVGAELNYRKLRGKLTKMFILAILQALGAFLFVCIGIWLWTDKLYLGLIFGTFATATAPAATVKVLKQYEASGSLKEYTMFILFVDDIIALIFASFVIPYGESVLGGHGSIIFSLIEGVREIVFSIIIGVVLAAFLIFFIKKMDRPVEQLEIIVVLVFLGVGLSEFVRASPILTMMIVGIVLTNYCVCNMRVIKYAEKFSMPLVISFFALIGLNFEIRTVIASEVLIVIYIVGTFLGKYLGAFLGGTIISAPKKVRNNMGFALLNQAGVALGIATYVLERFELLNKEAAAIGFMILTTITTTTIILQIIGPLGVKIAIKRTEELKQYEKNEVEDEGELILKDFMFE